MLLTKCLSTLVLAIAVVVSAAPTDAPKDLTARAGNEIIYLARCETESYISYEAKFYNDYTTTSNGQLHEADDAAPYRFWYPYQLGDQYMTFIRDGNMMTVHLDSIDPGWYNIAGSAWFKRHWDCRMDNSRQISSWSGVNCYAMYYCQ